MELAFEDDDEAVNDHDEVSELGVQSLTMSESTTERNSEIETESSPITIPIQIDLSQEMAQKILWEFQHRSEKGEGADLPDQVFDLVTLKPEFSVEGVPISEWID